MAEKTITQSVSLSVRLLKLNNSWEHEERAVYTADAMRREIGDLLSLEPPQPET